MCAEPKEVALSPDLSTSQPNEITETRCSCAIAEKIVSEPVSNELAPFPLMPLLYYALGSTCFSLLWWRAIGPCDSQLGMWLSAELALLGSFLCLFTVGARSSPSALSWFLQPQTRAADLAFKASWALLLPLSVVSLERGASWLSREISKELAEDQLRNSHCLTDSTCIGAAITLVVFGLLTIGYAVFAGNVLWYDRSIRTGATIMSKVEDGDLIARWGPQPPTLASELTGLSVSRLSELHLSTCETPDFASCSICLEQIQVGDQFRRLPCEHTFHKSCLDLWLLRQGSCPMCKFDCK